MELFSVTCATCRRQLRVRDAAAIGRILSCPKCGSMVEVQPPEGWAPPEESESAASDIASSDEVPPDETSSNESADAALPNEQPAAHEEATTAGEPLPTPRRGLVWAAVAVTVLVVVGTFVWTSLPRGTRPGQIDASADDVGVVEPQPEVHEPAKQVPTVVPDPPTDAWERFLYDQVALASLVSVEPFAAIVNARWQRSVAELNRDEIERIVYARRSEQLATSLLAHAAAHDDMIPAGAAGSSLLAVETRLSWIASILPELGQPAWHEALRFGRGWSADGNRQVAERTLWPVVDPGVAERFTPEGAALTHFVGMAGLGDDAAELDAADPRAGVFSYNEPRSAAEIVDGLSQTIAIMSVRDEFGPWAQGGAATVRPLTRQPYINGPDGFGSGAGGDGVLVGMADGSVRYFAANTDPQVLAQLATIAGGSAPEAVAGGVPLAEWLPEKVVTDNVDEVEVANDTAVLPEAEDAEWLIALEQRLALRVHDVRFSDVTVEDFCSFVARMAGTDVRLTADVAGGDPIAAGDTLSLSLADATLGELLAAALATRGLRAVMRPDGIDVLGAEWPSPLVVLAYDVSPLAAGRSAVAERIADLVRRFATADDTNETSRVGVRDDGRVVVDASVREHRRVIRLLGAFSVLAGAEPPVKLTPIAAAFGPDVGAIERRLSATVSLPAVQRVDWAELAEVWRDELGLNLTLDAVAVANGEIPLGWPGSDAVESRPLGELLDEWLAPLGLAHSWPADDTVRITTAADFATRERLIWHRLPRRVRDDMAARALTDVLRAIVSPGSWLEAGGRGDAVFDAASGYLLVRQTEPVQRQVQRFLAEWSEPAGEAGPQNRQ